MKRELKYEDRYRMFWGGQDILFFVKKCLIILDLCCGTRYLQRMMLAWDNRFYRFLLVALIVSLFFEGKGYSVQVMGARVRSVQIIEIIGLVFLAFMLFTKKWPWHKSKMDLLILAYVSINLLSLTQAAWMRRSVKIAILICSLALIYWLTYQLIRNRSDWILAFATLLICGTLEVMYGLYQVLAGALNGYYGLNLPIGYDGMVHNKYINSIWGRPYGTTVEPDTYGAICMLMALIFLVLFVSFQKRFRKWMLIGFIIALAGLYLSFVRAAWLAFFVMLPVMVILKPKRGPSRLNWKVSAGVVVTLLLLHFFAVKTLPPISRIHEYRFASPSIYNQKKPFYPPKKSMLNKQNTRLGKMKIAWQAFLKSPIIGNGPGSFAYSRWSFEHGEAEARKRAAENEKPLWNSSMVFTVLEDNGALGFVIFAIMGFIFFKHNRKHLSSADSKEAVLHLALFYGLLGLFMSYFFTSGLWLPMTWVLLALNMASFKRFLEEQS